jgi:acyl carrier protein
MPFGDAPCPACGHLLWFLTLREEQHFFEPGEAVGNVEQLLISIAEDLGVEKDIIVNRIADRLGVSRESITSDPHFLREVGADSLDLVELVMLLEEEFG